MFLDELLKHLSSDEFQVMCSLMRLVGNPSYTRNHHQKDEDEADNQHSGPLIPGFPGKAQLPSLIPLKKSIQACSTYHE